jgi:hypothetical protein
MRQDFKYNILLLQCQCRRDLIDPSNLDSVQGFKVMLSEPDIVLIDVLDSRSFLCLVEVDDSWRFDADLDNEILWSMRRRID